MRVLFPAARHDRFAHSLGVFFLGNYAFQNLKNNSSKVYHFSDDQWTGYQTTFEIACLLHDCGHSPLSHTFEHYYTANREPIIQGEIKSYFDDYQNFDDEYNKCGASSHEKISALILLKTYKEKIDDLGGDPQLAARMILGLTYKAGSSFELKFKNRLIRLLNGSVLDVDSLDYIQRDTWASGVSNVNIDYQRLLSSLSIRPDENGHPRLFLTKHAFSVLQSIIQGRNFLYKWITSHHIVLYEQELLNKSIEYLNSFYSDSFCRTVFSIDSFYSLQKLGEYEFFLPTDDDIFSILKKHMSSSEEIKELFSRQYRYKALWKTSFEFESIFKNITKENRLQIITAIKEGALNEKFGEGTVIVLEAKPKLKNLKNNEFFVKIDDNNFDVSSAVSKEQEDLNYFIIYSLKNSSFSKTEIINECLKFQD